MRGRLLLLLLLAVLAAGCGSKKHVASTRSIAQPPPPAIAPLHATFRALTHRPRVNTHWRYVVGANPTDASGAPIRSQLQLRVHVNGVWIAFGSAMFSGVYQDEVSWPPAVRGKLLIFETTVSAGGRSRTIRYWLRPR